MWEGGFRKNGRKGKSCLAFVLSGGGARGALQVGALRALLEAGIRPGLLVGTSVGAMNAAYLAVHGFTPEALQGLEAAWYDAAQADLLPANYLWLTVRFLFNRVGTRAQAHHLRDFLVTHGLNPDLRFGDLSGPRLILVAADLTERRPALYGEDLSQSVLEGLLASTAIPPWIRPLQVEGRLLIDGGAVSVLPIEPALRHGATEIIALDLLDVQEIEPESQGFGPFLAKLLDTVAQRQIDVEMALARSEGVPVRHLRLQAGQPVPIWDFQYTGALIAQGYSIARGEIALWSPERQRRSNWWAHFRH